MHLEMITVEPGADPRPTPLLFVHGAWHGAWCWMEHFLPYFAQHGYRSSAIELRGHGRRESGERLRWVRIQQYVADVAEQVRQFERPPVLIGHSMGGLVVRKCLESYQAPAAILLASVPPTGVLRTTLSIAKRHPLPFLRANLTMKLYPIVGTPVLTREAFFSKDMPQEQVDAYFAKVQNESYLAFLEMMLLSFPRPGSVKTPLLVLGGRSDTIFTPKEVEATGRAYDTKAEIFPQMAHDMMLEPGWQSVADRMLSWLEERGL